MGTSLNIQITFLRRVCYFQDSFSFQEFHFSPCSIPPGRLWNEKNRLLFFDRIYPSTIVPTYGAGRIWCPSEVGCATARGKDFFVSAFADERQKINPPAAEENGTLGFMQNVPNFSSYRPLRHLRHWHLMFWVSETCWFLLDFFRCHSVDKGHLPPRTIPPDIRDQSMSPGFDSMLVLHQVFQHNFHFRLDVVCGLIAQFQESLVIRINEYFTAKAQRPLSLCFFVFRLAAWEHYRREGEGCPGSHLHLSFKPANYQQNGNCYSLLVMNLGDILCSFCQACRAKLLVIGEAIWAGEAHGAGRKQLIADSSPVK